jgi:hypothetical protein
VGRGFEPHPPHHHLAGMMRILGALPRVRIQEIPDKPRKSACDVPVANLRTNAHVREIVVHAARDPITGRHRQVSRTFRGSLCEAKKARAEPPERLAVASRGSEPRPVLRCRRL